MIYYHITHKNNVISILEHGIIPMFTNKYTSIFMRNKDKKHAYDEYGEPVFVCRTPTFAFLKMGSYCSSTELKVLQLDIDENKITSFYGNETNEHLFITHQGIVDPSCIVGIFDLVDDSNRNLFKQWI